MLAPLTEEGCLVLHDRSPGLEEAKRPNARASAAFEAGTATRETADRYVRVTVVFALVLFLVAVGQRFRLPGCGAPVRHRTDVTSTVSREPTLDQG